MATKQFGKLKLHWSKRGLAYKWGDGEIHRLSFERQNADAGDHQQADGYDPNDPNGPEYRDYGRGYDQSGPYPGQDSYEPEGYDPGEGAPAGRYDVLYRSDWLMWLLLVVLPPLGIWILWKRERLEPRPRMIVSGVAVVWFIVLLVWIFSGLFGHGADQTVGVGSIQAPESIVVGATPTPSPTSVLTGELPAGTVNDGSATGETPAPAAQYTPRPGGSSNGSSDSGTNVGADTGDTGDTGDGSTAADDPDATYVWASNSDSYYHKTKDCTNITGTPTKVSVDIALSRGQSACPVCYGIKSSGTTYYASSGGKYYHKDKTCSKMKNAQAITLAQAQKKGLKACPVCVGAYYATKGGKYYHTKSNCTGMKNAQRVTKAQAEKAGLKPCPICVKKTSASKKSTTAVKAYYSTSVGKYYHVNPTCSGMKNAQKITLATARKRGQKPCPVCIGSKAATSTTIYYATTAGKYYHTKANCSGMKNARKITLATAKAKGKLPCPVCVKASSTTYVYATTAGKYYHSNSTCSGMKDARKVTLAVAKKAGKTACPICIKKNASTIYYYSTVGGKYYHAKSNCSGMKNATKVTLATAKKRGQKPCPICLSKQAQAATETKTYVYATNGGKYYHAKANCSGMKNARKVTLAAAKASGKTACPVCMKSKTSTSNATFVYSTLSGKYYHKKGCNTSDAEGAKKVALVTARAHGKTACPVCFKSETVYVYVTPAGLKYHSKVNCSGIHNTMKITLKTAIARKYIRCTVCDAPKP